MLPRGHCVISNQIPQKICEVNHSLLPRVSTGRGHSVKRCYMALQKQKRGYRILCDTQIGNRNRHFANVSNNTLIFRWRCISSSGKRTFSRNIIEFVGCFFYILYVSKTHFERWIVKTFVLLVNFVPMNDIKKILHHLDWNSFKIWYNTMRTHIYMSTHLFTFTAFLNWSDSKSVWV